MKVGDLVQHTRTDTVGILTRMYEVENDSAPYAYMRCVVQVGIDGMNVISGPINSFRIIQEMHCKK